MQNLFISEISVMKLLMATYHAFVFTPYAISLYIKWKMTITFFWKFTLMSNFFGRDSSRM